MNGIISGFTQRQQPDIGQQDVAVLDLGLDAFWINLAAVTPLFEVAFSQHCSDDIQSAG